MNIYKILHNLFCNPKSDWILSLDDKKISTKLVHDYLSMYPKSIIQASILNKYLYSLPPKMYLSGMWSVLFFNGKKLVKIPFIKYKGKKKEKQKFYFMYEKIQRHLKMSDNEIKFNKDIIDKELDNNKVKWFSFYGINKNYWNHFNIDYNLMKKYKDRGAKKKDLFSFT